MLGKLLLAISNDVDVVYPQEFKMSVLVHFLALEACSLGLVGHGAGLWARIKEKEGV